MFIKANPCQTKSMVEVYFSSSSALAIAKEKEKKEFNIRI